MAVELRHAAVNVGHASFDTFDLLSGSHCGRPDGLCVFEGCHGHCIADIVSASVYSICCPPYLIKLDFDLRLLEGAFYDRHCRLVSRLLGKTYMELLTRSLWLQDFNQRGY